MNTLRSSLLLASQLLVACQGSHHSTDHERDDQAAAGEGGLLIVKPRLAQPGSGSMDEGFVVTIEECTEYSLTLVGAPSQRVGEEVPLSVHPPVAMDDEYVFTWSASEGEWASAEGAETVYTCTEPGRHTITVVAVNSASCPASAAQLVECVEPEPEQ